MTSKGVCTLRKAGGEGLGFRVSRACSCFTVTIITLTVTGQAGRIRP